MAKFHRYLATGLGQHRCAVLGCNQPPTAEVHIAGMNQESTGTELVTCPSCQRNVPTDFTVRVAIQLDDDTYKRIRRLCRDCAEDPAYGKRLAQQAEKERTEAGRLEVLMSQLEQDEITQEEYDLQIAELMG